MRSCIFSVIIITGLLSLNDMSAQSGQNAGTDSASSNYAFLEDLAQPGVSLEDDSLLVTEEAQRLLADADYRCMMYPDKYTWEQAMLLISEQKLKPAFWHLMNLFRVNDQNKKLVVQAFLTYDKVLQMDKVLVNTFYTYIYMDLEASKFVDGKPVVTAPDIMESKLNTLRDILFLMEKFRDRTERTSSHG